MYRRGRPGRDRSRDPSRPFSQGRERDFDRNYRNREERPPGHREDFDRRGGRDDRLSHLYPPPSLPPPPPLAPTPSGLPSGPAGHLTDQLANYPSSKPPRSRRDSRDSTSRDTLPLLDTTRRQPGGRKEFAEPSPRERGMIGGDPQVAPPRRNSAWSKDKDDDRVRTDTRRNSIDRTRLSRSPIVESPRNFPPPSPATSITATPITSTTTNPTNFALMTPSAPMHPIAAGGKDHTRCALIFQEASSAYIKYLEAQTNLKTAEKERSDHAEHFNAFPAMKDRYEGNAKIAKKEFTSAQEILKQKSAPLEDLCRELFKEQRNSEGTEFLNKVKKELGNSSLTQFVKSSITAQAQGPSKDEFQQLRNELRDMKRKQDEEEKTRQNFANEFYNYKNELANKFRVQSTELGRLEGTQKQLKTDVDKVKDDHHKTAEELKKAMSLLAAMKNSVDKLQEAGHQFVKGGEDVAMTDAGNDVGTLGGRVDEVLKNLGTLQKDITLNQQKLEQTISKCSNTEGEIKALQQKVSKLEASGVTQLQEDRGASSLAYEEYATKDDILKLEGQIRYQDRILDDVRKDAENDTTSILEVVGNLEKKTENHIQATTERFQESNERFTSLLAMQEKVKDTHMAEIKEVGGKFTANFANFHRKFQADVAEFTNRVGYVEGRLEAHTLAISHVDQRMNAFTTKDFYERVVHELVRINPLLFNTTNQINNICIEMKTIKEIVRVLDLQVKKTEQWLNQANLSTHPVQDGPSMGDGPSNGSLKPDRSSEGPLPSSSPVLAGLENLRKKVDKIEEDLSKHIEIYLKRMNDIKDWTASAAQRLAEGAESTNANAEDIKYLRTYLGQRSGSPVQIPSSGMDRWRVVNASNQDTMQGLPDENANG